VITVKIHSARETRIKTTM